MLLYLIDLLFHVLFAHIGSISNCFFFFVFFCFFLFVFVFVFVFCSTFEDFEKEKEVVHLA